jgi:hypothetical protein
MLEYRLGKLNGAADVLSRRAEEVATVNTILALMFELFDKLRLESESDPQMTSLLAKLLVGEAHEGWSLHEDLMLF